MKKRVRNLFIILAACFVFITSLASCDKKVTVVVEDDTTKKTPTIVAPTAKENLFYTGEDITLINIGTSNDGYFKYKVGEENYSTDTPKAKDAGSYNVYYKFYANEGFKDLGEEKLVVTINKSAPQIEAPTAIEDLVYTGNNLYLINEGRTNFGRFSYSLDGENFTYDLPTAKNAGTYRVWYMVEEGKNNNASEKKFLDVTIAKANPTYNAPTPRTGLVFDGSSQILIEFGYAHYAEMLYSMDGVNYSTNTPMATNAGTYKVWYKIVENDNVYGIEPQSFDVTIAKATITNYTPPKAIGNLVYNGENQVLIEKGLAPGGHFIYRLENETYPTDEALPSAKYPGLYKVYYKSEETENFNAIEEQYIEVRISSNGTKINPVVTAPKAKTLTYNGEEQTLIDAATTTGGTLKYSINNTSYSENLPKGIDAGTYTVYYKVDGDDVYSDVAVNSISVTIAKVNPTVKAPTAKTLTYNGNLQALINEGETNYGDIVYKLNDGSYSTDIPEAKEEGTYTVYYKVNGNDNWNSYSEQSITVTINPEPANTITINSIAGGNETLTVSFDVAASSANEDYNVYYSTSNNNSTFTNQIDKELIFIDGTTATAYIVGLEAGTYYVKVEDALDPTNYVISNLALVSAQDRSGYAHFNYTNGVGAYNDDGTLKTNAKVLYVTDDNKNDIEYDDCKGLVAILQGAHSNPIDIRIIGTIKTAQWNKVTYTEAAKSVALYEKQSEKLGGKNKTGKVYAETILDPNNDWNSYSEDLAKGIKVLKGLNSYASCSLKDSGKATEHYEWDSYWNMCDIQGKSNITIEGIGTDATIFQWGFTFAKCNSIEIRNLTFDDYTEDAIGIQGGDSSDFDYSNYWIHNCTFEEGVNNWDISYEKDKGDGDGSTDFKYAHNLTISYCVYNGTHKTNLIGANNAAKQYNITLHHNYYLSCNARLPLVRQANIHIYNNYYKGTTSTGISARAYAFAFVENNYFDGKNPFMLAYEVKDKVDPVGTTIKAIGNYFTSNTSVTDSSSNGIGIMQNGIFVLTVSGGEKAYSSDLTATRTTNAPSTSVCNPNGSYVDFDTDSTKFYYDSTNHISDVTILNEASDVPTFVLAHVGAGANYYASLGLNTNVVKKNVTFHYLNEAGTEIKTQTVSQVVEGGSISRPTNLTIAGYELVDWYTTSEFITEFDFATAITDDIDIYAKFRELSQYTISYKYNNGSSDVLIDSDTYYENEETTKPSNPTLSGYKFVDWYTNTSYTTKYEFGNCLNGNITIYAKFEEKTAEDFVIKFNDVSSGSKSEDFVVDNAVVKSTSSKSVSIDTCNENLGGISITKFLKLGGTRNASYRSVDFTLVEDATITAYYKSSSTSETRHLALYSNSTLISEFEDAGSTIISSKINNVSKGDYSIGSYNSGVSLYLIVIEYSSTESDDTVNNLSLNMYSIAKSSKDTKANNGQYITNHVKTIYRVGDSFDSSYLSAYADKKYVELSELTITGYSNTKGEKTISVNYKGVTETFKVYVLENSEYYNVAVSKDYTVGGTTEIESKTYITFKTIEQALEYLREFTTPTADNRANLLIKAGYYNEKIEIDIPYLTITGEGIVKATYEIDENYNQTQYDAATIIEWNSLYGEAEVEFNNVTDSTQTVAVRENVLYCEIKNLTISNWWNDFDRFTNEGKTSEHRALALLVQADCFIMNNVSLLGYQDTVEFFTGRSYLNNCYITGATDYIFGTNGTVYIKNSTIHTIYNGSNSQGGFVNAFKGQNASAADSIYYGAIYDYCIFEADTNVADGIIALGRPWTASSSVMIMNSNISAKYSKEPTVDTRVGRYVDWDDTIFAGSAMFLEYNNDGLGAITSSITGCSVVTSDISAQKFSDFSIIFGRTNGNLIYDTVWDGTTIPPVDTKTYYIFDGSTTTGTTYNWTYSSSGAVNQTIGDLTISTNKCLYYEAGYTEVQPGTMTIDVAANTTITINTGYNTFANYTVIGSVELTEHECTAPYQNYYFENAQTVTITFNAKVYLLSIVVD